MESPSTAMRANPVAMEIPVNATGTRPGDGPSKRELFSEETITVLLFHDGAVVRLSAAVAAGQLIFLTHKESKKEVVCQVVGKRSYRPTSCYVELQFTEAMPDFWGITFPSADKEPITEETAVAAGLVECAEETEDAIDAQAPPPSEQEVEHLREEVEVLRQQLRQMMTSEATTAKSSANAPPAAASGLEYVLAEPAAEAVLIAPAAPRVQPAAKVEEVKVEVAKVEAKQVEPAKVETVRESPQETHEEPAKEKMKEDTTGYAIPWPKDLNAEKVLESEAAAAPASARSSHVAMTPPNGEGNRGGGKSEAEATDREDDFLDDLLPKPALDFSKAPNEAADSGYKAPPTKMGKVLVGVLVAVVVVGIGLGGWKAGLFAKIPQLMAKKSPTSPTAVPKAPTADDSAKPAAEVTPGTSAAPSPAAVGASANPSASSTPGSTPTGDVKPEAGGAADAPASGKVDEHGSGAASTPAEKEKTPSATERFVSRLLGKKKAAASDEHATSAPEVAPVAEDAPVIPAKLVKSVPPVYPPDAMRAFITGDVSLKAEVDENGRLRKMEVVSGPTALRAAALDALKQYQYAAATRGGKGVASEVTVVIKFWFDP